MYLVYDFRNKISINSKLYDVLYSFSIDDGTSSAFVSCSDRQVAELLDLMGDQWAELEELVQPLGHVTYELVSISSLVPCKYSNFQIELFSSSYLKLCVLLSDKLLCF